MSTLLSDWWFYRPFRTHTNFGSKQYFAEGGMKTNQKYLNKSFVLVFDRKTTQISLIL
jgi:hypothetical protein